MGQLDWETEDALNGLVREAYACAAAGDGPRLYALYTEAFLRRASAGGEPGPVAWLWPPGWRGWWVLPDGRVGGVFGDEDWVVYPEFVRVGGRWLIDDAVPFVPDPYHTA